ncbi:hypothetical protein P4O66_011360 [Electrophorus voltai]|uniref:Cytochrome P450, family 4, subfamily F, polypeptide 3 n=1 Tax=Electrophorus voltai TaxID=2609070 RepID=A0AAD9DUJ3_9TELE|nr:hypothetical protein P4O66_011360 [Electrophorus voltai]
MNALLVPLVLGWSGLEVLGLTAVGLLLILSVRLVHLLRKRTGLSCFAQPPMRNWLLGHMGMMRSDEDGLQAVDELVRTYRHSCAWFLGPFYNMVRLFHPDYVKPLLLAPGQSLLLTNGTKWSRQRRLLTPAFHFDILKNYIYIFNKSTNIMHENWRRLLAEGKKDFNMFEYVSMMTLDSLLKCTFSYDSHCQECSGKSDEYISAIFELSDLAVKRQRYLPHHWDWVYHRSAEGRRFRRACEIVHSFTAAIVQDRRSKLDQQGPPESFTQTAKRGYRKTVDFIDVLLLSRVPDLTSETHSQFIHGQCELKNVKRVTLMSVKDENGEGLSNEEIKAQADTFMFAGHDTTASAISWVLYNLAMHQEFQDRCRSEINDLLSGRDSEEITWDDLSSLTFTTMCIKESLRLHSPISAVTRYYSQDMSVPGERIIPAVPDIRRDLEASA